MRITPETTSVYRVMSYFKKLRVHAIIYRKRISRHFVFDSSMLFLAWFFRSKKVCYQEYGCFQRHPVWPVQLPQNPSRIKTRFNLFTRENRNSAQLVDDRSKYKLSASHFNISRRTIFVIHGFTGKCTSRIHPRSLGNSALRCASLFSSAFSAPLKLQLEIQVLS